MSDRIVSFVPGPAHVVDEVLRAMAKAPIPHRSAEFGAILTGVQQGIATMLRTRATVFPVLGSGTTALEAAFRGVARRRVLVVSGGAFGDRLATVATAVGLTTERLAVVPGWPVDADVVERALSQGDFDTVAVVHCETQTGALTDIAALGSVVAARPGTALIVDAVSSFGGADIAFDDLGPVAVLVSVSGKALACPPGVAVMAVSDGAAERAAASQSGDYALRLERLVTYARRGETPQTPSTPVLYALAAQLPRILDAEGGMAARAERHRRMSARVVAWAEEHFEVLAREDARSPTVTTIANTAGIDVAVLLAATERRGFRIAAGYGELKGATFRIGHMGDVTVQQTAALLAALDEALVEIRA